MNTKITTYRLGDDIRRMIADLKKWGFACDHTEVIRELVREKHEKIECQRIQRQG